jgi:LuxR family transcriptional regulator, quorum-sensing system regulator BjaR1
MNSILHNSVFLALEGAEKIPKISCISELKDIVQSLIVKMGFKYITVATVRRVRGAYLHESNFQTWPDRSVQTFVSTDLFRHDPIIARSRTELAAFFWSLDEYDSNNPHHQKILAIRSNAEVTGGCCAPVPERVGGHSGGRMVLFASGHGFERSREVRLAIQILAGQVAAGLASLESDMGVLDESTRFFETTGLLTAREKTILSWIASGKSSWEIAKILSISTHTVNTHIEKALIKLGAANRVEAVAKAIILNELDIDPR